MSKIRDLFKKILPKKKSSSDLDDIFIDDNSDEELADENLQEFEDDIGDEFDQTRTGINVPIEPDLEPPTLDASENDNQDLQDEAERETLTAKSSHNQQNDDQLNQDQDSDPEFDDLPEFSEEMISQEFSDAEIDDEIDGEIDDEIANESEASLEEDYEDATAEIDLEDGKLSLRDRVEHLGTRVKDRFRNVNKKDLNQAYKKDISNGDSSAVHKLSELTRNIDLSGVKNKVINFNWATLPNKFFSDQNKRPYHRYFQMAMILFFTYAIAYFSGSLFSGDKKYNELGRVSVADIDDSNKLTNQDIKSIADSGLFKTAKPVTKEPVKDQGPKPTALCKVANKKSSLPVQLVDTIVLQDSVKSIAAVQMNSRKDLTMAREGDELKDIKVGKIEKSRVIFRNLGSQECEYIEQKQGKRRRRTSPPRLMSKTKATQFKREQKEIKGIKQDGNTYTVERAFLKSKLSDINTILTEAKGIMIKNPDGTVSFKIVQVDPGGIFAYLGVQENDIINTINGEPIKELNDVMSLFGKLPTLNKLELGFDRAGQPVDQKYKIE